jgi:hypothetical protein
MIFLTLLARFVEDEDEGANAAVPVPVDPDGFLMLEARLREWRDDDTGRCGSAPCPPPPPKGMRDVVAAPVAGRWVDAKPAEPDAEDRDERNVEAVEKGRTEADRSAASLSSASWSWSSTRCDRC